jgi:hypothetical protein
MLGAALLAVGVAKLFLVDLGALSGLPRVIAFLGAGIVLLGDRVRVSVAAGGRRRPTSSDDAAALRRQAEGLC